MKIQRVQLVMNFAQEPDLMLSAGSKILQLSKDMGCQLARLNVPEASPPDVPRIILRGPDVAVAWALTRVEVSVQPAEHIQGSYDGALAFSRRRANAVIDALAQVGVAYEWSGVVTLVAFPTAQTGQPAIRAVEPVFDRLVSIARGDRQLATFQLQFGFVEQDCHVNFTIDGYETREGQMEVRLAPGNPFIRLDASQLPLIESGVQIQVDINHRQRPTGRPAGVDVDMLVAQHLVVGSRLSNELGLEGVLS